MKTSSTIQTSQGLTSKQAATLLKQYGFNEIEENTHGAFKKALAPLISPISCMLLVAAILSLIERRLFDGGFILFLYILNFGIQRWQDYKADTAILQLQQKLSFDVSTLRNGVWKPLPLKQLVPGDHIRIGLGCMIPADARVLIPQNLMVNEAALSGESLPKEKKIGDSIYSGTFITSGNVVAEITATGRNTSFGKALFTIETSTQKSLLEQDILRIARFLTITSLSAAGILSLVFFYRGRPLNDILTLDISLIIAGIPVALPAVMAFILSIGAVSLAKKQVIVRRLSALQDLANVNLLLTDKTGTLTKNEILVSRVTSYDEAFSEQDIIRLASYATQKEAPGAIDVAILKKKRALKLNHEAADILHFIPYDPDRKRSTALIRQGKHRILISLGAPQVIQSLDEFSDTNRKKSFERDVQIAAAQGYRSLAIAIRTNGSQEEHMRIIGLLALTDTLDESAKDTIHFMQEHGIHVKMLTGDNHLIAERISEELALPGRVLASSATRTFINRGLFHGKLFDAIAAFSEILPQDKYEIVKRSKKYFVVAATGDGINDLGALKIAHVGIAVSGAVSALKSSADIVLLSKGVSVIKDGVIEARKIFVRLYNYSIYRISESFRLIITIFILGILYGLYPLSPLQLIILALLNDIPIVTLAVDRVHHSTAPAKANVQERFALSLLFGSVGVANSLILFFAMRYMFHLTEPLIQTIFFLKLTVSGHALIFVAHTGERWYRYLPSKPVILATLSTQILATTLALTGWLMPSKISFSVAVLVWLWALLWMQVSEGMKHIQSKIIA